MNALITDIKRFAVHDGDGIRTTVFFKGCPMKCLWCHNPETISKRKEIGFFVHKCIYCGACADVCRNHIVSNNNHQFFRESCIACKNCVDICQTGALTLYGKELRTEIICEKLLEDIDFYKATGGGITLSGGECLLQPEACQEILMEMKKQNINTAVDTCGMVPWNSILKIIDYTDIFLYDIKAIDDNVHKKCTGVSNKQILDNLKKIDNLGKRIEIRVPFVPGLNDNQMDIIPEYVSTLNNVVKVRILPYHNFSHSKYAALGIFDTLSDTVPTVNQLETIRMQYRIRGIICM